MSFTLARRSLCFPVGIFRDLRAPADSESDEHWAVGVPAWGSPKSRDGVSRFCISCCPMAKEAGGGPRPPEQGPENH